VYSPDDQAVLEAAYKLDAKPDKAARLQLVEQVALGEKEVQVRNISSQTVKGAVLIGRPRSGFRTEDKAAEGSLAGLCCHMKSHSTKWPNQ